MNWNPMMGPLGAMVGQQFQENQLGRGVTLGNPQAQEDYVAQLARALADSGAAGDLMDRANALKDSGWIDNSGLAGVAERMFSGWASKKMSQKARDQQADAETRRMAAQEGVDDRRAMKEADRTERVTTRERTRRQSLAAQMGLNNREAVEFIETGKVPQAVRKNTVLGEDGYMYNVDPYNSDAERVRVGGGERIPPDVRLDPGMSPEERAAAMADIAAGAPAGDQSYEVKQGGGYLRGKQPQQDQESYGQPQPVTGPDGKVRMVQFGNRGGQREVTNYAPPPTARDARPPGEGERNAAGYYSRMDSAGRELDALVSAGYDPTNMRDRYTAGQGPMLNWAASEKGQNYRQQQEDWVRAKLRKESGAVIGDEEMAREISTYFPEVGDKPDVLKAKERSRRIAEEAMRKAGGRAIDPDASANDEDLIRKYL